MMSEGVLELSFTGFEPRAGEARGVAVLMGEATGAGTGVGAVEKSSRAPERRKEKTEKE